MNHVILALHLWDPYHGALAHLPRKWLLISKTVSIPKKTHSDQFSPLIKVYLITRAHFRGIFIVTLNKYSRLESLPHIESRLYLHLHASLASSTFNKATSFARLSVKGGKKRTCSVLGWLITGSVAVKPAAAVLELWISAYKNDSFSKTAPLPSFNKSSWRDTVINWLHPEDAYDSLVWVSLETKGVQGLHFGYLFR